MARYDDGRFYTLGILGVDGIGAPVREIYGEQDLVYEARYAPGQASAILAQAEDWRVIQRHCAYHDDEVSWPRVVRTEGEVDPGLFQIVVREGAFAGWQIGVDRRCRPCGERDAWAWWLLLIPTFDQKGKYREFKIHAPEAGASASGYSNILTILPRTGETGTEQA